jgi:acyl-CoA hydrolase
MNRLSLVPMELAVNQRMTGAPALFANADLLAEAIVREVGTNIVLALPLGLGKAIHVANALYARAAADRSIRLKIFTALTLERPQSRNEFERRFIEPAMERLFGDCPELAYANALRQRQLPSNIEVSEFFFLAGQWLSVSVAQQSYISANYTHAARYIVERGVNVVAQLVAKRVVNGEQRYSLSCNTDITLDLLKARAVGQASFMLIGQVNSELPFMPGQGDIPADTFSHILEGPGVDFSLFAAPKEPVSLSEYATGLHVARLVADGGTLQIGIGSEGDAVAQGLILRHRENAAFRDTVARLTRNDMPQLRCEDGRFEIGLYGLSEMFVDTFLELIKAGVVKREVDGALLHAAFFVGPKAFYRALRDMNEMQLSRLQMTAISFVNELYGDEEVKRRARVKARFINSGMIATLLGAIVSDALEDGRVVSGVGGQYNFVSQAFALNDARAVITLQSVREADGKAISNIRWSYGHETIPRHLRDIVVSEYGVADLRGKTDQDVIGAMLAIADSRFQSELLRHAKHAGKIPKSFEIPSSFRENTPDRIERALAPARERGLLPPFPFGTDFTETEQRLIPALEMLKEASGSSWRLFRLAFQGLRARNISESNVSCLARLGLARPTGISDRFYSALLRAALTQHSGVRED